MPGKPVLVGDGEYRSRLSTFTFQMVFFVSCFFMIDTLLRGTPDLWLIAGSALLAVCVAAWEFIYKPCLRLRQEDLVLRGPVREITVPYAAVRDVQVRAVVTVTTDDRSYSAWAGPERNRRFAGDDAAHDAATLIRSRAADARGGAEATGGAASDDSDGVRVRFLWVPWAVCAGLATVSVVAAGVL